MMSATSNLHEEILFQTSKANFSRAIDANGKVIYLETSLHENPSLDDLLAIKNDFEITHSLQCKGVLRSHELIIRPKGLTIVKNYFDGIPLSNYLQQSPISLSSALEIMLQLSNIVTELHAKKIIHKDINPENILISEDGKKLEICYFGIATQLAQETQGIRLNESLKATLTHISPEQTGRMNRSIDYRSDLYSLGVLFYQLVCGKMPFAYQDVLELIHAHIARYPTEPHLVKETIPKPISDIIMKLLAKNAEDRYQSAHGLVRDVDYCLQQYRVNKQISSFTIASFDYATTLNITEKLYGRKTEIERLTKAFEESKFLPPELILVCGYSGIGKTRLIHEIDKPVSANHGYFISGKFDQFHADKPYSAIRQAFGLLIKQFLSETDESIALWKEVIISTIEGDGQVLVDIIPELELLLGPQSTPLPLGLSETNKRFVHLFQRFLQAIVKRGHPLVLFMDDLQWTDSGSFDVLHQILTNTELRNLLVIGAYRDNEVNASHPFQLFLRRLQKETQRTNTILKLQALSYEETNLFIADSLRLPPNTTQPLTEILLDKTQGNPFFIKQFLKKLHEEQFIYFDEVMHQWKWRKEDILTMHVTDNVVDFMIANIQKLAPQQIHILQLASCIGNIFDIKSLALVAEMEEEKLASILWELIAEGFIQPKDKWNKHAKDTLWKSYNMQTINDHYDYFHFHHDRIQQAAYAIIDPNERKNTHIKIGRLLWRAYSADRQENKQQDDVFDMLKHFNFSLELLHEESEKLNIAQLNYEAGEKAKKSNAHQAALQFYKAGMEILHPRSTGTLYTNLLLARSETEYLCGHYEASETLFNTALEHAITPLEKASVLANKMRLYENTNRQREAIQVGITGLRHVGIYLPQHPSKMDIILELGKSKFHLRNISIEDLKQHRLMKEEEKIIAMRILMNLWSPAFLYNQNLLAFSVLRMVNLSVLYGNCTESALAYAFYGFVHCAQLKQYHKGNEYGKLGIWLNEKFDDTSIRAKLYVIYYACVAFWTEPFSLLLEKLFKAHEIGVATNDLIWAAYALNHITALQLYEGGDLKEGIANVDQFTHFARKIQYPLSLHHLLTVARANYLIGKQSFKENVFQTSANEVIHLQEMNALAAKDGTALFLTTHSIYQGLVCYHFSDFAKAKEHFVLAQQSLQTTLGIINELVFDLYYVLTILALTNTKITISSTEKSIIQRVRKRYKILAITSPANYEVHSLLVEAEWHQYQENIVQAEKLYAAAREKSMTQNNHWFIALAAELSALFYERQWMKDIAHNLWQQAVDAYAIFGAVAKTGLLYQAHPNLVQKEKIAEATIKNEQPFTSSLSLDIQSIFKATTLLSSEIVFEKMVVKLMQVILENAGAQKVILLLNEEEKLKVVALADTEHEKVQMVEHLAVEKIDNVSHAVVQLSFHGGETILLSNASEDNRFNRDGYLQKLQIKSVLCIPIKQYGKIIALIYLENNIATGAFTPDRLELLSLLSGQIAISIENALLYENLEQKVVDRTETIEQQKKELEQEKEKSENLLLNILPIEIAEELKKNGCYKPRRYENVSILFADFEGFTKLSERITTEELVDMIDYCYKHFDEITSKYHVEKIKTIGDSYMCASGLPVESKDHAVHAVQVALDMLAFVEQFNEERKKQNLPYCAIRIGIHSGSVAAGVVGNKKFAYDIWGDAVNIASRLESNSEGGRINISGKTYALIHHAYPCTYRGKISIKNRGEIDMYFLQTPNI
jgi:histidine kinase